MTGPGLGSRMFNGAASYVPFTPQKRERKLRERVRETEELERARHRAGQPDQKSVSGDHTTSFNRAFIDAIRRGQSRTEVAGTPDMLIREVICNPQFIDAIRSTAVPTPLEEHDSTYAYQSARRRAALADQLDAASTNRRNVVGNLSPQDLDMIYSLMVRRPDMWNGLPPDVPRPSEVFMQFLEAVAQRQSTGKEGEFIGMVLKDLSTKRTFTDSKERPNGSIMDPDYASTYLYRQSAESLEHAVDEFGQLVREILNTPTHEANSGVPGLGYAEGYANAARGREQRVRDLDDVITGIRREMFQEDRKITIANEQIEAYVSPFREEVARTQREEQGVHANAASTVPDRENATRTRVHAEQVLARIMNEIDGHNHARDEISGPLARVNAARTEIERLGPELQSAEREFHEANESLRMFNAEAGVEIVARQLTDHFRTLLIENRETGTDMKKVADRIAERLPNVVVTELLNRATELLTEKESLALHLRAPEPQPVPVGQIAPQAPARPDYRNILQPRIADYEREIGRLDRDIADASLPHQTIRRLQMVVGALREWEIRKDFVEAQISDTRNNHALPLRRAALQVVERMGQRSYENIAGISRAQRLVALQIWETTSETETSATQGESWWAKTKHKMGYHILSGRGWRQKGRKLWSHSFGSDIDYLTHNPRGKVMGRDMTETGQGNYYQTIWPRWLRGSAGLFTKAIALTALTGYMVGQNETTLNPLTWAAQGAHTESRHWYTPWTWFMPLEAEKKVVRVIHDHYDIPERLSTRGSEYYREAYGVGRFMLSGETDGTGAQARLAWLQTRQPVLVFMQERKTMKVVKSVEQLGDRPANCSTSAVPVPKACNDLGLKKVEDVAAHKPVEVNTWKPGMQICCTIKIEYGTVSDGLRLNTHKSDEFVAALMAAETAGTEITSEFLNSPSNRMSWVRSGYLVSELEFMVMETHKVTNLTNVQFLLSQGTKLSGLRSAMSEIGDAEYHVKEADRNGFLRVVRSKVVQIASEMVPPVRIDPTVENVPPEILTNALEQAIAQGKADGTVTDTHVEFKRKSVQKELGGLKLDQEALDICVVQSDIKDLMIGFTKAGSPYRLNAERAGDFVRVVAQNKGEGVDIAAFGPGGSRINWAVATGLVIQISQGTEKTEATTTESAVLSPEGKVLFEANNGFSRKLDATVTESLAENTPSGNLLKEVLAKKFGGSEDKLREAVKADWYGRISEATTNPTKQSELAGNGVIVSVDGETVTVSLDGTKAGDTLKSRLVEFTQKNK